MSVARNVVFNPTLAPGGGATEMAISVGLSQKAKTVQGVEGWPFQAVADAMEVIPRTLVQNAGGNAIRVLTELRVRLFFSARFAPTLFSPIRRLARQVSSGRLNGLRNNLGYKTTDRREKGDHVGGWGNEA
jgi:chaperonin GroEL (HSP60 family)